MKRWVFIVAALVVLAVTAMPAPAEERTIVGTISKIDLDARTFSVTDGMGVRWNYKALPEAAIDLSRFEEGDRVSVSVTRATPLNMMVSADYFRKGDRIVKIPY